MFKPIVVTTMIAATAATVGHVWRSDSMPGDPAGQGTVPAQQGTALTATPAAGQAPACNDEAPSGDASEAAEACLFDAADDINEQKRAEAIRRAARLVRAKDGELADLLLMTSAARGDLQALADYAAAEDTTAENALLRREAALMAADGRSPEAQAALDRRRAPYRAQALSRPEVLWTLLEGRGLELADDMETRRYLLGLTSGFQRSCPFQSAMWESAGFAKAHEQYAAPVVAVSHTQLASSAGDAISHAAGAIGQFVRRMDQGAAYADSGAGLMRDLRDAQRKYNASVSRVSEAGARDGVRIAELMVGCSSVDGTRLNRALMDIFSARARQAPARG